jgi:hypothetical protein
VIDDGKTSMEKSGQADSNVLSMNLPAEHRLKLDAAIRGELTLYPIRVLSETEYVNLAKVLTLASNVGIRRIYVSFNLPMGKTPVPHYQERLNIMWNLRGICAPLNARYSVVSSYPKRFLICVSFCKPITVLENTPLDGG